MDGTQDDCGCCAGTSIDTPVTRANAPGLPSVLYRVGSYGDFRSTVLARLSSTDYPALAGLSTRDRDDWTVALADGFACLADVITFYQQRIANESWLRTATERRSVLELGRLIGYQLAPGVAASTVLAFTLETSPGAKALAARPVTIAAGARVQSVPDADQSPQTFETTADITARVEWNAIPAQTGETIAIAAGLTELYVVGTGNNLQPGDAILIVGRERLLQPGSERWDVRWLDSVETDTTRNITRLAWSTGLGDVWSNPAALGIHVYVFRQRAALFGNSAPDPNLVWNSNNQSLFDGTVPNAQWKNFVVDASGTRLDLDASYPKVVRSSWIALAGGDYGEPPTGYVELYRVQAVSQLPRTDFGLSAKVTRIRTDGTEHLSWFHLRTTHVLVQSEELQRAQRPLLYPVFGSTLTLGRRDANLQPGQALALSGKLQRVAIPADTADIAFDDGRSVRAGASYRMAAAPARLNGAGEWIPLDPQDLDPGLAPSGTWQWSVVNADGGTATLTGPAGSLLLQPALDDDDVVSEALTLTKGADAITLGEDSTALTFSAETVNCYDRKTLAVNANVAPATHGESVAEIGGSGDAAQAHQRFVLKQLPMTYISSSGPGGAASTLQARVGDVLWNEVPTLYGTGPNDRVFSLSQDDESKTMVQFGDGVQGARLPSAQNNLRFSYRKGLGEAGNLRTGQLSTLLTRPLGVKGAANPVPSTGGQDAETLDRARDNAPLRVLTLDRAVSARDYADFSRAFAGIAKASALWINNGRARGIYVTVAGSGGGAIAEGSATQANLVAALRAYGDALLPLTVRSYMDARFSLAVAVRVDPAYDGDATLVAVEAALRAAYAFDAREFGQPVGIDEVYAVIQGVAGVVASDVQALYRTDDGPVDPQPRARLFAALPAVQADGGVNAAELLTLDDGPISLGVMS